MDNTTLGEEAFSGWFGRQSDGKFRLLRGANQAAVILLVKGLEGIHRLAGPGLEVTPATLVQADRLQHEQQALKHESKRCVVNRLASPPAMDGSVRGWNRTNRTEIKREGFPENAHVHLGYDQENLYVMFDVADASPWKNGGQDFDRLFKTGDAVDLQFCADPRADAKKIGVGHTRLLFAPLGGQSVCVLMKPVDPQATREKARVYRSPVGEKSFDRVEVLDQARVKVRLWPNKYVVQAVIPLASIGLAPTPGLRLSGEFGFISSDAEGTTDVARTYWSNQATGLTKDLPLEAWLEPATWGEIVFE